MLGKTHLLVGFVTVTGTHLAAGFIQPHVIDGVSTGSALCLAAAGLGALTPDIDAEDSQIKHELGPAGAVFSAGIRALGVTHRGVTHYGLTALVIGLLSVAAGLLAGYPDVGLAFFLGYLSHILADSMTLSGTPLLFPFLKKNVHLVPRSFRIRTGGPAETLLSLALVGVLVLLAYFAIPPAWIEAIKLSLPAWPGELVA